MKGGTSSSNQGQQTTTKTEKQSPPGKFQPTAEQVRYAQLLNNDEPKDIQYKIHKVIEMTQKPMDEVAVALHDCDYNVDSAVLNLLEGKNDEGQWTTFHRKKKSAPADVISPVNTKDKAGNQRQDRKENRDSGGVGLSQSVEYNNKRNKGQFERISDGNSARQNGPLNNTRPPGGGRNRNRDDREERRGDQEDRRGNREDRRDDRKGDRDNRRDRGGDRGEQSDDRRNRNDFKDRDRNDRGNRGNRGDREDRWDQNDRSDRGDRGGDRGDRGGDRSDRDRNDRGGDRWNSGDRWSSGDRGGDRGGDRSERRFNDRRGGFNRRGGMGRGGRGGSRGGSRGGRYPNNRTGGRRFEQMNGPSKEEPKFPTTTAESWDVTPEKEDKDWTVSEPAGTTEEWGAEDWGNEKPADTANTPSWATTDEQKSASTWEADAPANQKLANHANHLPECDDDAILSSKVASKPSPSIAHHEETARFSTPSSVSPQSRSIDTSKSFGLTPDAPSNTRQDSGIAALASAGLSHHASAMNTSRPTTTQAPPSQQPAVTMAAESPEHPQPQRQQKSRTKRVPKGQIPKQAVEMPGNNGGIDSLDVQFGNLEFSGDVTAGNKPEEMRVLQQKEETMPLPSTGNASIPQPVTPAAVVSTVPKPVPKPVTITTTSMTSESAVVNSYEQMPPRHYPPPSSPVSKSAMTQITPEPSPRKENIELREPKTPPMTKKVDVSTSPMPLTTAMTQSIAKNNNEGVASRATSLHSQIEAIATSEDRLEERVHQQAPAIGHSPSPHADQNPMRARLAGVDVTSSSTTRPNPTPAGVSLSSSGSAGPPPGIISGIQPTTTGPPKTSGTNRQTAHGTKAPNLPPGVMPLYGMQPAPGFPGFSPLAYPLDDIQVMQRMPMQPPYHYDMSFPVTARDGVQNSYSGNDVNKYNRNDASSPVPSTLNAGPHGQQAPFINTHAQLHPFGYPGNLAFYHGGGMIGGFAAPYTTQMYQLPTKGPGVTTQFQQNFANQLGPHYTSGYDGLSNTHDFGKQTYQHPTQSKANSVSGTTASNSPSDLSTAYKTQFTDKGYLSGTPPPLNISLPGQAHQHHPAGFPLMPVLAPTQHPPSLFPSHHLSHQQLDNLNQNRGAQNQGKVSQNKSHHGQSIYPQAFWSGTN